MSIVFEYALKEHHFYTITHELEQKTYRLQQTHGFDIIDIEQFRDGPTSGDGLTSTHDNIDAPLCIFTADCLPVSIIGNKGIALIHAGWRGVENNICISKEVANLEPQIFLIGPHIRECCFEVSKDFRDNFPNSNSFIKSDEKTHFSLENELTSRIKQAFPTADVISTNECTCCDQRYFSFRRNKTKKRNWNLLLRKDSDIILKN